VFAAGPVLGGGEMAKLYRIIDRPCPYLVLMKWNPGHLLIGYGLILAGILLTPLGKLALKSLIIVIFAGLGLRESGLFRWWKK
jgi:hypothetical protein